MNASKGWRALAALLLLAGSSSARSAPPIAPVAVRSSETLRVDGAELFLLTRGGDRRAPVLLWLHGGPGAAERPLLRHFNGALEAEFVVAYWDQRGAGRSFDPKADPRALTVARHLADLERVVAHLKRSLGQERIALVGHSWGGALGLLYARDHPGDVAALAVVAPLVSARESQQAEYEFVRDEASQRADQAVLRHLREIGPPPWADAAKLLAVERVADGYGAVFHRRPNRLSVVLRALLGGLVAPWEIPRLIRANEVSLQAMQAELLGIDLARSVPAVEVPVFFLLGRHDRHADARIAARFFARLRAPHKELLWFEESAHNVPFEEPERFNAALAGALRSVRAEPPRR